MQIAFKLCLRIDTRNSETGLIRYSLLLPYAKQRHVTTERLFLAIPAEIGALIRHYIERARLKSDGKLFEFSHSAPFNVSRAVNQAILCFSPPDYQAAVARGEAALPTITPTDLRHNVGHSLAMQGVSAEEIAHILGHSSLTVAKYYILATPALALIRAKALGINPVWQNMVAMMLTGELTSSTKWQDQRVVGIVGDQLHDGIGGCSRDDGKCPFSEVRCCYGCLYFRPFSDGDHQAVLESVVKEVDELISVSDSVGNARNPLLAAKWVCFSKSKICNAWNGSSRVPVRSRVMVFSNTICPPHAECLDTPSAGDWRGANIDYASRHIRCGGAKYINNSLSRAPAKSHG